jgi:uncharacterized protein YjbI with pentapeptide repeats
MANPEHLEILNQGVDVWNEWTKSQIVDEPDLSNADLVGFDLRGADLSYTFLDGTVFWNAELSKANFNNAYLIGADLRGADLSNADLRGATLYSANLSGAELGGANLTGVKLNYTIFAGNDLSQVKGLETAEHSGPSFLSIDTIYKSQGKIPMYSCVAAACLNHSSIKCTSSLHQQRLSSSIPASSVTLLKIKTLPNVFIQTCKAKACDAGLLLKTLRSETSFAPA